LAQLVRVPDVRD